GALAPIILGLFLNLSEADRISGQLDTLSEVEKEAALSQIALQVVNPYIGIVITLLALSFWLSRVNLPEVSGDEGEAADHDAISEGQTSAWACSFVVLGFITLFLYVSVEVLAGYTIINYGKFIGEPLSQASFFPG